MIQMSACGYLGKINPGHWVSAIEGDRDFSDPGNVKCARSSPSGLLESWSRPPHRQSACPGADGDFYRIAPLRGRLGLTYHAETWYVSGEGEIAAEQTRVSVTNSEAPTDGYAIVNLFAGWTISENMFLNAGVENLLDEAYEDHLAGYNRIAGSDVSPGARLPGVGINGFVRLEYVF